MNKLRYHPPMQIGGQWLMEVEDLVTRGTTERPFPDEASARKAYDELTKRQQWDKSRAQRGRTR